MKSRNQHGPNKVSFLLREWYLYRGTCIEHRFHGDINQKQAESRQPTNRDGRRVARNSSIEPVAKGVNYEFFVCFLRIVPLFAGESMNTSLGSGRFAASIGWFNRAGPVIDIYTRIGRTSGRRNACRSKFQ